MEECRYVHQAFLLSGAVPLYLPPFPIDVVKNVFEAFDLSLNTTLLGKPMYMCMKVYWNEDMASVACVHIVSVWAIIVCVVWFRG